MNNTSPVQQQISSLSEQLFSLYPELSQIEKSCWLKLLNKSLIFNAPPQTIMQTLPGPYDHLLLLIEGNTRAYKADDSGREVTIYRTFPGDLCSTNLQNLFNTKPACLYIQAEKAIHALQISAQAFNEAISESEIFKQFIFSHVSKSFTEVTHAYGEMVFNKLDTRLCNQLKKLFSKSNGQPLNITHQQLANELGTTREVISRSLKALEKQGCLKITRGQLTMISPEKLQELL